MSRKRSYIGTLNAIANGERVGYELFSAWSMATTDDNLRPVLDRVAIREMEHSWAFEKRLSELGFSLQPSKGKSAGKLVKLMKSKASDEEKFAALGIGVPHDKSAPQPEDRLLQVLADASIDPQTGALLGRFICEERESGRDLNKAWRALRKRSG